MAVTIGTTGSPVPCQRLRQAHATSTPDTVRTATRQPPDPQRPDQRARLHPGNSAIPRFRCHRSPFRCVSSGSLTFVFFVAHLTARSGLFRNAHNPGSLPAQLAVVWDLRLIGDPGGPTSITSTAWFMTTTFYIVATPFSGHTADLAITASSPRESLFEPPAHNALGVVPLCAFVRAQVQVWLLAPIPVAIVLPESGVFKRSATGRCDIRARLRW